MDINKDIQVYVWDGSAYQLIDGITVWSPGALTWSSQDTTPIHTASKARTFETTLYEVQDFTFTMLHVPDDPGQAEVVAANASGEPTQFKFNYPDHSMGSFVVNALVNTKPIMDKEQLFGYDVSLKITGAIADQAATLQNVAIADAQAGAYVTGESIVLRGTWDEYVWVTGTPRIGITLDSGTVYATYSAGSGTSQLTFSYTFQGGDQAEATEFVINSPIGLNGGTIKDAAEGNATLTFTPPTTTAFTVNPA